MPKILLTGMNGQVGYELQRSLLEVGEVFAFDRQNLDISKPAAIREAIQRVRPQIIVNAAAYTAVDKAESDVAAAQAINADAVQIIAEEAKKISAMLVHYSTDYVFDGSKTSPYSENDPTNPVSVYGKSKLAGDQAIQQVGVPHLIFRTAWIYSTRGRNFLLTILRLASEREELRVVRDQVGAPTWCREIAAATTSILSQLPQEADPVARLAEVSGLYHMTAGGVTTWYDFACAILDEAAAIPANRSWLRAATDGRPLKAKRVLPIRTEEYPTPARRPAFSVLSNSLLKEKFGLQLQGWREQLHAAFVTES